MYNFLRKIIAFFHKKVIPLYSNEQLEIFNNLISGDVIYACMPLSKEELQSIPEGHRARPYLVVGKNENYVIGYECRSKMYKHATIYESYPYHKIIYIHNKESFFSLEKVRYLPIQNIYQKFDPIISRDKKAIEKRLRVAELLGNKNIVHFDTKITHEIGDIVKYENNQYLIYQIDHTHIYVYQLYQEMKTKKQWMIKIIVNKITFWVDIKSNRILSISNEYLITGLMSKKEMEVFFEKKKALKKSKKKDQVKNIEFAYPIDRTITNAKNEEYIYLYTFNYNHYGIKKDLIHLEYTNVTKIPNQNKIKSWAPISRTEVHKLVYELILQDRDPQHMLHHVLEKLEKDSQIKQIIQLNNMEKEEELQAIGYK